MRDRVFQKYLNDNVELIKTQSYQHQEKPIQSITFFQNLFLFSKKMVHVHRFDKQGKSFSFFSNGRSNGFLCRKEPQRPWFPSYLHNLFLHELGAIVDCVGFQRWFLREFTQLFSNGGAYLDLMDFRADYESKCRIHRIDPLIDTLSMVPLGKGKGGNLLLYDPEEYLYLYGQDSTKGNRIKPMKGCPDSTFHIIQEMPRLELFLSGFFQAFLQD